MRRLSALLLAGLVLAPAAAHAATKGPVFGLRAVGNNARGYFVYTLTAGASQSGAVIVSNVGTAAGTVKLFTADATTGNTTGTVYETDKQPKLTGAWVRLSQTSVTLAPNAHKTVSFTVHVPAGTPAGQWVGGIVAETSHALTGTKTNHKANIQIKIRDLTIVAVQANVPGPQRVNFSFGNVTTGGQRGFQQVLLHIESSGNVLTKPTGKVTIFDSSGKVIETLAYTMDTFLPRTAIEYPVLLKKALPAGNYRAVIHLATAGTTGAAKAFTAAKTFAVSAANVKQVFTSASPTQAPATVASSSALSGNRLLIGGAAGGAIVVLLLLWWLLRQRRRRVRGQPPTALRSSPSVLAAAAAAATEEPPFPEPPLTPAPAGPPAPTQPPAAPAAPPAAPAPTAAPARPAECTPHHFWEVAYDRGQLGNDGVWRFPHRCRNCGLELLASDIAAASLQADAPAPPR